MQSGDGLEGGGEGGGEGAGGPEGSQGSARRGVWFHSIQQFWGWTVVTAGDRVNTTGLST